MTQIERALGDSFMLAVLVGGPILLLFVLARRSMTHRPHSWLRIVTEAMFIGSILGVLAVTLRPALPPVGGLSLVPFTNLDGSTGRTQLMLNVVLTVPVGFFGALSVNRLRRLATATTAGLILCLGIEVAQMLPIIGRVASTEDLLAGTAGVTIGAWIGALLSRLPSSATRPHSVRSSGEVVSQVNRASQ